MCMLNFLNVVVYHLRNTNVFSKYCYVSFVSGPQPIDDINDEKKILRLQVSKLLC